MIYLMPYQSVGILATGNDSQVDGVRFSSRPGRWRKSDRFLLVVSRNSLAFLYDGIQ